MSLEDKTLDQESHDPNFMVIVGGRRYIFDSFNGAIAALLCSGIIKDGSETGDSCSFGDYRTKPATRPAPGRDREFTSWERRNRA